MDQFNQPQQETVQANPMDDMQKWLQMLAMMKKNNMGFWKKGDTGMGIQSTGTMSTGGPGLTGMINKGNATRPSGGGLFSAGGLFSRLFGGSE